MPCSAKRIPPDFARTEAPAGRIFGIKPAGLEDPSLRARVPSCFGDADGNGIAEVLATQREDFIAVYGTVRLVANDDSVA